MASPGDLILAAARNNALLCDAVSRAHGITPQLGDDAWTSAVRTPPLYPDAVTLKPGVAPEPVLARVDSSTGCSIKDSFAELSLRAHGFSVLIEAQWIVRRSNQPRSSGAGLNLTWRMASEPKELALWEDSWRENEVPPTFPPSLLHDGPVFLGAFDGDSVVGGAIANYVNGVVGVSNVFARSMPRSAIWPGCLDAISRRFPDLPIVGYESGAALNDAVQHGFTALGPLRVWLRDVESTVGSSDH